MSRFVSLTFLTMALVAIILVWLEADYPRSVEQVSSAGDQPAGNAGKGAKLPLPLLGEREKQTKDLEEDPDVKFLKRMSVGTDERALIAFLKERSQGKANSGQIEVWIGDLGSESFEVREKASKKLLAVGYAGLPLLRKAQSDADKERAERAKNLIKQIEDDTYWGIQKSVVKLVIAKHTPEGLKALLRYLPFALGDETINEIWYGINSLASQDHAHPVLVAALADPSPNRRALAACILGRSANREITSKVCNLLKDPEAIVRLRAAQGLLAGHDKTGIPILISLLSQPSIEVCWQAEELLHWVAGPQAPQATIGAASAKERETCRAQWEQWWRQRQKNLDLHDVQDRSRHPGLLLVCETKIQGGPDEPPSPSKTVSLIGCDGRYRWKLAGLPYGVSFELLPSNSIMLADMGIRMRFSAKLEVPQPGSLSLVDLLGRPQWQRTIYRPIIAQKLPNGNFLILNRQTLLEFSSTGEEQSRLRLDSLLSSFLFSSCRKTGTGTILCTDGREVVEFAPGLDHPSRQWAKEELMQDCRFVQLTSSGLILATTSGSVGIFDPEKNYLTNRFSASRSPSCLLANGNIAVADYASTGIRLAELDKNGNVAWQAYVRKAPDKIHDCFPLVRFGFNDN